VSTWKVEKRLNLTRSDRAGSSKEGQGVLISLSQMESKCGFLGQHWVRRGGSSVMAGILVQRRFEAPVCSRYPSMRRWKRNTWRIRCCPFPTRLTCRGSAIRPCRRQSQRSPLDCTCSRRDTSACRPKLSGSVTWDTAAKGRAAASACDIRALTAPSMAAASKPRIPRPKPLCR